MHTADGRTHTHPAGRRTHMYTAGRRTHMHTAGRRTNRHTAGRQIDKPAGRQLVRRAAGRFSFSTPTTHLEPVGQTPGGVIGRQVGDHVWRGQLQAAPVHTRGECGKAAEGRGDGVDFHLPQLGRGEGRARLGVQHEIVAQDGKVHAVLWDEDGGVLDGEGLWAGGG